MTMFNDEVKIAIIASYFISEADKILGIILGTELGHCGECVLWGGVGSFTEWNGVYMMAMEGINQEAATDDSDNRRNLEWLG